MERGYRARVERATDEGLWTAGHLGRRVLVPAAVILGILAAGFTVGGYAWRLTTAVADPAALVAGHEWFHQQAADIAAADHQITLAAAALAATPAGAEQERLRQIVLGLRQHRASLAATYNARAAMATRGWLRAAQLPERF